MFFGDKHLSNKLQSNSSQVAVTFWDITKSVC
jgi:hypothetical protein